MAKTKVATTPQTDNTMVDESTPVAKPRRGEEGWTDYILNFATDKELKTDAKSGKKAPFVHFLRRITLQEWGEVISSKPLDVQIHELDDYEEWGRIATVTYEIQIKDRISGDVYTFADVADVHEKNCDFPFYKFGPASASTRAESRAYRKALCLNIVGAEELSEVAFLKNTPPAKPAEQAEGMITPTQVSAIKKFCRDLYIDVGLFLKSYSVRGCGNLSDLTSEEAEKALKLLSQWFRDRTLIDEDLRGTVKPA